MPPWQFADPDYSWLSLLESTKDSLRLFWRGFLDGIYCWDLFWKWLWVSRTAKLSLVLLNFITKTPPRVRNCWYSQVYSRVSYIQRVEIVSRNFFGLIWQTWLADILDFYNHSGILLCGRDGDAWELIFLQDLLCHIEISVIIFIYDCSNSRFSPAGLSIILQGNSTSKLVTMAAVLGISWASFHFLPGCWVSI